MSTCSYSSSNGILDYLDEKKFLTYLTTITFVIIGIFLFIVSLYRYFEKEKIPRVAQPSAPYGNIKDVIYKDTTLYQLVKKYYNKLKRKQLKFGGMYIFFKPTLVIVDSPLVREILLNREVFIDVIRCNNKHLSQVSTSAEVIEDILKKSCGAIEKEFVEFLKNDPGHFQDALHDFVLNSMCLLFDMEKNPGILNLINAEEKRATTSSFRYYFSMTCPYYKRSRSLEIAIMNRKLKINKCGDKENEISSIENNADDIEYVNNFIENVIFAFHTSLFCLYELSKNMEIQEEIIGEIRRFNNSDKKINDLPYLEAVVKETLRVYPPVPLIIKKCDKDYESSVADLKLKRGNFVLIPTSAIHHDPSIYVSPENFDPDRFLEDDIEKVSTFIPFGTVITDQEKRHKEFQITIIVIKTILVSIFSHFKVSLKYDNYFLTFDSSKVNMQLERPLPLKFEQL